MSRLILAATIALLAAPAIAQDHAMPAPDLPPACLTNAKSADAMAMNGMTMPMAPAADTAHTDLMAGMDRMDSDMAAGATATDIDVAFACAMIPHHRGAIAMAKAILAHGDDPWIRTLAEGIVTAQEKEIADMEAWLAKQ